MGMNTIENIWNSQLLIEISDAIKDNCQTTSIEEAIRNAKYNNFWNVKYNIENLSFEIENQQDREDRDPEVLIFIYVSHFLQKRFSDVIYTKNQEDQLALIYEAIAEFLFHRDRSAQIERVIHKLKHIEKNSKSHFETQNKQKESKKIKQLLFSLFM